MSWAVVLREPKLENITAINTVADVLKDRLGVLPYDATRMARDAVGLPLDGCSEGAAQVLAESLQNLGIAAGAIETSHVPDAWETSTIRSIAVRDEGVRIMTGYVGEQDIPWERMFLVNACLYREPLEKQLLHRRKGGGIWSDPEGGVHGTGSITIRGNRARMTRESFGNLISYQVQPNEFYVIDLYVYAPFERFRINSNRCLYPGFRERSRPRSEENLQLVLQDIGTLSTVSFSPLALRYANGDPLTECVIDTLPELDRYARWLILASSVFGAGQPLIAPPSYSPDPPSAPPDPDGCEIKGFRF